MKLIIGLGNPGEKYRNNRHNAGYLLVDELHKKKLPSDIVIKKSDVFMNNSGGFVANLIRNYKLKTNNLYVVHDDLDIKLGEYKLQFATGPKIHNGITSVEDSLGTKDFWRIRIGVDNRNLENRTQGEEYVLEDFTSEERETLDGVLNEICKKLATL